MRSRGDEADTVDRLFRRHYGRLVGALAVAVGPHDAADAVQDAFLAADRHWRRVRNLDDPAAWVRRVALNRLSNQRRSRARRDRALARLDHRADGDLDASDLDLIAAIRSLPERQRLAVCLYYVADLPVHEIAAAMGITSGTVKSTLHEARRMLRAGLEVRDG